ncbi:MAG: aminotransferase class I/II-fold pyridoxal phosphate-dependent enzyme [Spirochaetaceae bacterium]|jgi:aspartate/methionine/tyrosine aminotransferase|nr:aminotransferase class I/II-fold pyridoxal phosphate-dependent enzyme [Spirochaetaceae bacterium]
MSDLAAELNAVLAGTAAGRLLSALGRRMFFPRGIIAQAAEAKQRASVNATLGMAYRDGKPLILSALHDSLPRLSPAETVVYAPTAGVAETRAAWKEELLRKNPSLRADAVSLPIVTPGITAGISYTADLFLDEGDTVAASFPSWDNYRLIFEERRGAVLREIPFFGPDDERETLDLAGIERGLRAAAEGGALRVILNFPNNPSGYAPARGEADALADILFRIAGDGADVLVFCDDAYFGLFYEDGAARESLFARLAGLHERIVAVKIDGPTKEDYAWGLRMAFVTLGSKGLTAEHRDALEKKYMGLIRSSVSCANTPAQYLMLKTLTDSRTPAEKEGFFRLLESRYRAVRRFLAEHAPHPVLRPLPFNAGYFMCFRCTGINAEDLRRALLDCGVGTVALGDRYLRVTFAAIEEDVIKDVYEKIYAAALRLAASPLMSRP